MKAFCKSLILILLACCLSLALLACTGKKDNTSEDDSWMKDNVDVDKNDNTIAHPQTFDDSDDGAIAQSSGGTVNLPIRPWGQH